MIAYLKGFVHAVTGDSLILDVNGVGYEIYMDKISLITFQNSQKVLELFITTIYSQDNVALYGFPTYKHKAWFSELIKLNGISGRIAMAILGGINVNVLEEIIAVKDEKTLNTIPGIGKKLANRIVNELDGRAAKVNETILLYQKNNSSSSPPIASAETNFESNVPEKEINISLNTNSTIILRETIEALISLGFQRPNAHAAAYKALEELGENITIEELVKKALSTFERK